VTPPRALLLLAVAACGAGGEKLSGNGDGGRDRAVPGGDAGFDDADGAQESDEASTVYPAAHPPMPRVVDFGGPRLAHPRIVPVFYEGDALMGTVLGFLTKLTTSMYWFGATAEYGVGSLVITAPVVVPGTPPASMTDAEIQALILAHLNGEGADAGTDGGGAWPTPDTDTIYAIYFAEKTSIAFDGITSCTDFAGYHDEVTFAGGTTSYAVLPRCAAFALLPGRGTLDILTVATSHELAEAATDPFPFTNAAYAGADDYGSGWSEVTVGGEIGDMCVLEPSSFYTPADLGFMVQRVWSNASAGGSHDPCAPVPAGDVYFSALPDLSKVEMTPGNYLDGVQVSPGGSAKVTLHLFSDAKTAGPWDLSVTEAGEVGTRIPPDPLHQLSFSLERPTGANGESVLLTIHRKPLAGDEKASGLAFQITSTLGSASHSYWGVAGY
jgi:hypothetical protein